MSIETLSKVSLSNVLQFGFWKYFMDLSLFSCQGCTCGFTCQWCTYEAFILLRLILVKFFAIVLLAFLTSPMLFSLELDLLGWLIGWINVLEGLGILRMYTLWYMFIINLLDATSVITGSYLCEVMVYNSWLTSIDISKPLVSSGFSVYIR